MHHCNVESQTNYNILQWIAVIFLTLSDFSFWLYTVFIFFGGLWAIQSNLVSGGTQSYPRLNERTNKQSVSLTKPQFLDT